MQTGQFFYSRTYDGSSSQPTRHRIRGIRLALYLLTLRVEGGIRLVQSRFSLRCQRSLV